MAFSLVSCLEIAGSYDRPELAEIDFSPVLDVSTKSQLSAFANGQTIVVASRYNPDGVKNTLAGWRNYFPATNFTYNSSTGVASSSVTRYWPLTGTGTLDFLAYAAQGSLVSSASWNYSNSVSITTNSNTDQYDLLVGCKTGATASDRQIQFWHGHALICIRARSSVQYSSANNLGITVTSLSLNQCATNGTLTASHTDGSSSVSMSWSGQGTKQNGLSIPGFSSTTLSQSNTTDYSTLGNGYMLPTQASTGQYLAIGYTLHNGKDASNGNVNVPMVYNLSLDGTAWQPGMRYNYDITFNLYAITVTTSVSDWSGPTNSNVSI